MIGRLVEAWCLETGVAITPYGSWTLEDKEAERGVREVWVWKDGAIAVYTLRDDAYAPIDRSELSPTSITPSSCASWRRGR